MRWPKVVGVATGVLDRAFVTAIQVRSRQAIARADAMPAAERLARLLQMEERYDIDAIVADPSSFFPAPGEHALEPKLVRAGVWEASWESASEPFLAEVAERWRSRVENRTARARFYLAGQAEAASSRPAVIAVHGYMGGHWLLEENQWPIAWLVRRGLDVVLPVLPLHAARAGAHRGSPPFPGSDPRLNLEGFRQAVTDIRSIVRWLRRRGAPHVGVMGMSLGGYTSALVATVTSEIDFAMPIIPLASLADYARDQGRLGSGDDAERQHAALERAHAIASPLARPLRIPKERVLVVAAEHDRITPPAHAARLAKHFGSELLTIGGAHLVQLGRGEAFRALARILEREGIVAHP